MTASTLTAKEAGKTYFKHMAEAAALETRAANHYANAQLALDAWAKQEAAAAGIHTKTRLQHRKPEERHAKPTGMLRVLGFRGEVVAVDDEGEAVLAIHIKVCPLSVATDVVDNKDKVFFVKLNGLLADYEVEETN